VQGADEDVEGFGPLPQDVQLVGREMTELAEVEKKRGKLSRIRVDLISKLLFRH
jgi:hypothetical protein